MAPHSINGSPPPHVVIRLTDAESGKDVDNRPTLDVRQVKDVVLERLWTVGSDGATGWLQSLDGGDKHLT